MRLLLVIFNQVYPHGEFTPILGHGNMARKMGLRYDRLDIPASDSLSHGAKVNPEALATLLTRMMNTIVEKPTCVIPSAYEDPYMEAVLK